MTLDEAMRWLAAHGGKVHVVRRTADHEYYQVVVGAHRSHMVGVAHHGRTDVPTEQPEFATGFVEMVEAVLQKLEK